MGAPGAPSHLLLHHDAVDFDLAGLDQRLTSAPGGDASTSKHLHPAGNSIKQLDTSETTAGNIDAYFDTDRPSKLSLHALHGYCHLQASPSAPLPVR